MRISTGLKLTVAGAALALAAPAIASGDLACMAENYDAANLAQIDQATAEFELEEDDDRLGDVAMQAAISCMVEHDWSEDAAFYASIYEVSRLIEAGYRESGRLSPVELGKVDAALADGDNKQLWEILERLVVAGLEGQGDDDLSTFEEFYLGAFVVRAGLSTEGDAPERVGELLGLMAMQRHASREFDAVESGE